MIEIEPYTVGPIEAGIPIPDQRAKLTLPQRRVLELRVGESFEILKSPESGIGARLQSWARGRGIRLATRAGEDWSVRVWRVE